MTDRSSMGALTAVASTALAAFFGLRALEARAISRGPEVAWRTWNAGFAEARRTKRRVLVVYGAVWCRPCRTLERRTLVQPKIARKLRDDFVCVHVDVDREPARAKEAFLSSIPNLRVMTADERTVTSVPPFTMRGRMLLNWLDHARTAEPSRTKRR